MSALAIAGFPHVANSSFTGRIFGKVVVELVARAARSAGSADYAVVLHDRFNPLHRAVVSYTRFLTAVRSADPNSALLALYSEARNSGILVAARDNSGSYPKTPAAATVVADAVRNADAKSVSEPNVGNVVCGQTEVKKDKDWAFDRMTELLKVALYDKEVADVIKRLTHVL